MDKRSAAIEQELMHNREKQRETEDKLRDLWRTSQEETECAEDFQAVYKQEFDMLEKWRDAWRGSAANGFHRLLEEEQARDAKLWQRALQAREAETQEAIQREKRALYALEEDQQALQKRWRT
ncbi:MULTISPECIES: hypothetical protein [Listeria]|uniref:hypothetical protein n=1 Tax=Listeria TaxID=1637 RepID=UPI000B58B98F|nr:MULTISPECIES: hypothetical protein [Listeria]